MSQRRRFFILPEIEIRDGERQYRSMNEEGAMGSCVPIAGAIEALVLSSERLRGLSFRAVAADTLWNLTCLITLRRRLGENRPAFVGFTADGTLRWSADSLVLG